MSVDLKKTEKVNLGKSSVSLPENERSFLSKLIIPAGVVLGALAIFFLWSSSSSIENDKNTSNVSEKNTTIASDSNQDVGTSQPIENKNSLISDNNKSIIVYFATNDDVLKKDEVEKIKAIIASGKTISEINAYCDQRGDRIYNKNLAKKRLQAVKQYLPSASYDFNAIGSESLICNENTEECYTKNRRVEMKFQ